MVKCMYIIPNRLHALIAIANPSAGQYVHMWIKKKTIQQQSNNTTIALLEYYLISHIDHLYDVLSGELWQGTAKMHF